jgi:D-alanyl-D-alanine carboxypeptidase (penicillin-binding protein 5/6)
MKGKRVLCAVLAAALLSGAPCLALEGEEAVFSPAPDVAAPSAILTEKRTGQVLFEKNADEKLEPRASPRSLTILLIVEAIEDGRLTLEESVTASARAAGMGGSQIFLAEGESMSVRDMLKAIVVASANDAAVAMAEKLAGRRTRSSRS